LRIGIGVAAHGGFSLLVPLKIRSRMGLGSRPFVLWIVPCGRDDTTPFL
jgi:hypothetical protein